MFHLLVVFLFVVVALKCSRGETSDERIVLKYSLKITLRSTSVIANILHSEFRPVVSQQYPKIDLSMISTIILQYYRIS